MNQHVGIIPHEQHAIMLGSIQDMMEDLQSTKHLSADEPDAAPIDPMSLEYTGR